MNNIDEILLGLPKLADKFPNGISDYLETYYEIVCEITQSINMGGYSKIVEHIQEEKGRGGLYDLAEELTDKFEHTYEGVEWGINDDVQYFDAIDKFLNEELYEK